MTRGCHCEARSNEAISSLQGTAFRRATTLFLIFLSGCAAPPAQRASPLPPAPYSCLLPAERRMLVAELFFARGISGRAPVTDAEWAEFAAQTVTPNFPDGFTVFDGQGQWRNPHTGHLARDPTKVLLVAAPRTPISRAGSRR